MVIRTIPTIPLNFNVASVEGDRRVHGVTALTEDDVIEVIDIWANRSPKRLEQPHDDPVYPTQFALCRAVLGTIIGPQSLNVGVVGETDLRPRGGAIQRYGARCHSLDGMSGAFR